MHAADASGMVMSPGPTIWLLRTVVGWGMTPHVQGDLLMCPRPGSGPTQIVTDFGNWAQHRLPFRLSFLICNVGLVTSACSLLRC